MTQPGLGPDAGDALDVFAGEEFATQVAVCDERKVLPDLRVARVQPVP